MKASKFKYFVLIICLFTFFPRPVTSWLVTYKEEFYNLYHIHYQQYPDDCIENIYWLEKACKADFCNPQYALSRIENEKEWEKYRYLFMMHVNLKLIEQHLRLGRNFDKKTAHFYDAPWKDDYLRCLEKAETCYKTGIHYWNEAKLWAEKANQKKFQFLTLTDIQVWEDENYRIFTEELDYSKTINRELKRIEKVKKEFEKMDNTY